MTNQAGKDAGGNGGEEQEALAAGANSEAEGTDLESGDAGKTEEQLWAEMDAADGEPVGDVDANGKAVDDKAGKDDGAGDDDEQEEQEELEDADGAVPAPDKNADGDKGKPPAKGAAPDKGAAADQGTKEPTAAELKAEVERLKAENQRLEHSDRSQRNRISALQRGGKPAKPAKPAKREVFAGDKGKALTKDYPEIAGPVAAAIEPLLTELDDLKADRKRREEQAEFDRRKSNETVVFTKHPDFDKTVASGEFGDWLMQQPDYVKAAVARNQDAIVDAAEAVDIVDRFKAFRSSQAGGDQTNTQEQGKGGKPNAQDGPAGDHASGKNGSSLSGKRQRQLDSASGTRSGAPGLGDGVPEEGSEEEIWKAFDRKEAREQRQQQARRA